MHHILNTRNIQSAGGKVCRYQYGATAIAELVKRTFTVRLIRTYYDRQNKDIDEARNFLRKWQSDVAKRLTADDQEKAKASKVLRLQEFAQLRQDQVKIHTGNLAGHLLVDVLTADLMESAAA